MITKGPAIDKKESAFLASVQGYSKGTDRVLVFEKGPLDALVRFEFGCLGMSRVGREDGGCDC